MSQETKVIARTIDLTPTWSGILGWMLAIIESSNSPKAVAEAKLQMKHMADVADAYVAMLKENERSDKEKVADRTLVADAMQDGPEQPYPGPLYVSPNAGYIRAQGVHGWNIAKMEDQPPYTHATARKLTVAYNYHDRLVALLDKSVHEIIHVVDPVNYPMFLSEARNLISSIKSHKII